MKKSIALFFVLCLFACGQPQPNYYVDLSKYTVLWQGDVRDSQYFNDVIEVQNCLRDNKFPYIVGKKYFTLVIIAEAQFDCNGMTSGCYSGYFDEVYISAFYPTIMDWIVKHEAVHWATGLHNESHGDPEFTVCVGKRPMVTITVGGNQWQ